MIEVRRRDMLGAGAAGAALAAAPLVARVAPAPASALDTPRQTVRLDLKITTTKPISTFMRLYSGCDDQVCLLTPSTTAPFRLKSAK